jgi:hypothetical protein
MLGGIVYWANGNHGPPGGELDEVGAAGSR